MTKFRFYREDIYELAEQMQLPDEITIYNGLVVLRYLSTDRKMYYELFDEPNLFI